VRVHYQGHDRIFPPVAEITWSEAESERAKQAVEFLLRSWTGDKYETFAQFPMEDKTSYKNFLEDYKRAKERYPHYRWKVFGEYGGSFTNLKDAKKCAQTASSYSNDEVSVYNTEDGSYYIDYKNGKCIRDGWTPRH